MKIILLLLSCLFSSSLFASSTCQGAFANPITDYCWSCIFPIQFGGVKLMTQNQEDNNSSPGGNPLCICKEQLKVGYKISFWEPARMVDVTRTPYCFVGLGGIEIDFGIDAPAHAQKNTNGQRGSFAFYQVHWYTNPLIFWLEVLLDNDCLEQGVFDLAYLTEVDPLWGDSESTFIINPDVAVFSNPLAKVACAADCIATTTGFPRNELFWCNGCQGSMYPLDGWVSGKVGAVQASSLLAARMTYKLHRELLMWGASGDDGLCSYYPQPFMDKQSYKYSMLYPIPQTQKIEDKCCQPFGRSTAIWGSGKEYPYKGEDFSYQIYRKRDCCAGNVVDYLMP